MTTLQKHQVAEQLKKVLDPELGINIIDLGLVYEIFVKKNRIEVIMTLTTMGCPLGPHIVNQISGYLTELSDIKHVNVEFVWMPAWNQSMMSQVARDQLLVRLK